MQLSDEQVKTIKECLENIVDLNGTLPHKKETFETLVHDGGGYEINGVYWDDDEALYCWSVAQLLKIFDIEYDFITRVTNQLKK